MQLILDTLQKENIEGYYLIKFLYLTGLRIREAISLKWENIDFENGIIKFWNQKSKRYDKRPLLEPVIELLKEIRINTNRKDKVFYIPIEVAYFSIEHRQDFGVKRMTTVD